MLWNKTLRGYLAAARRIEAMHERDFSPSSMERLRQIQDLVVKRTSREIESSRLLKHVLSPLTSRDEFGLNLRMDHLTYSGARILKDLQSTEARMALRESKQLLESGNYEEGKECLSSHIHVNPLQAAVPEFLHPDKDRPHREEIS